MDIRLSAKLLLGLVGLTTAVMFSSSVNAQTCASMSSWEYAFMNSDCQVPSAILTVKRTIATGDYYNDFLIEKNANSNVLFTPSDSQRAYYDASFTGLVHSLRFNQDKDTPSKLSSALHGLLGQMWGRYTDTSLSNDERNKFAYLYFLTDETSNNLKGIITSPTNPTSPTDGLTFIQTYTALNGRSYGLWSSNLFYLFSRDGSNQVVVERRARSLGDLINYIEHQNRLIHTAPNGRRYGVRKYNTIFKINRDNGSLLNRDFISANAALQMLETCATNTKVPYQYHSYCGFDTYGRK